MIELEPHPSDINNSGESLKVSCKSCINGHRTKICQHIERDLYKVRKTGRPRNARCHCSEGNNCTCRADEVCYRVRNNQFRCCCSKERKLRIAAGDYDIALAPKDAPPNPRGRPPQNKSLSKSCSSAHSTSNTTSSNVSTTEDLSSAPSSGFDPLEFHQKLHPHDDPNREIAEAALLTVSPDQAPCIHGLEGCTCHPDHCLCHGCVKHGNAFVDLQDSIPGMLPEYAPVQFDTYSFEKIFAGFDSENHGSTNPLETGMSEPGLLSRPSQELFELEPTEYPIALNLEDSIVNTQKASQIAIHNSSTGPPFQYNGTSATVHSTEPHKTRSAAAESFLGNGFDPFLSDKYDADGEQHFDDFHPWSQTLTGTNT